VRREGCDFEQIQNALAAAVRSVNGPRHTFLRGANPSGEGEMSGYNRQQKDALLMVRRHLGDLSPPRREELRESIDPYLAFRREAARFQEEYFSSLCSQKCFSSRTSACCGREGILTFFADVVINVLLSTEDEIDSLLSTLDRDRGGDNCVYLEEAGCRWHLKPIICEMFLCDEAREKVLGGSEDLALRWEDLRQRERPFTLPTQPVLFDDLESLFIEAGPESPLMYFHRSPGLLRLKAKHGLGSGAEPQRKRSRSDGDRPEE
jgi:hypothetical protein